MKTIITAELFKEFRSALYNSQLGSNYSMKEFKEKHPNEYHLINSCYRARTKIKECIDAIFKCGYMPYFGTLTYDDERINNNIENLRKQARRHLNYCFNAWVMVEEYGEENNRYHIHFIACFKPGLTMFDFHSWSSRSQIEPVKRAKTTAHYLTDYMQKQAPRVRKNKNMIFITKKLKTAKSWLNCGFDCLAEREYKEMKQLMLSE